MVSFPKNNMHVASAHKNNDLTVPFLCFLVKIADLFCQVTEFEYCVPA